MLYRDLYGCRLRFYLKKKGNKLYKVLLVIYFILIPVLYLQVKHARSMYHLV